MKHIGLFEGIGGFSLAARWMGWETIAWCEIDVDCQKILNKHFPKSIPHNDIKTTDFSIHRGQCDIVTGGFPCQPFSIAGARKGKEDDRHLWPQMLRAIKEIQPTWVVGENVHGIINWDRGMVFNEVQTDLEIAGYEVQPFVLPACAVNAPHRRDRVWFIAHSNSNRTVVQGRYGNSNNKQRDGKKKIQERENISIGAGIASNEGIDTNANGYGCDRSDSQNEKHTSYEKFDALNDIEQNNPINWRNFPTQPAIRRGYDGIPKKLDENRLKQLGNAIVPQVAYEIFKVIQTMEDNLL